ncbi:MAG: SpoIVB peptidase [Oscillospiraceae bacterium]|jgi:stage IV sporulation protein B|nr:SpoIVB peptidase [Oscillospiraceae bacterium]
MAQRINRFGGKKMWGVCLSVLAVALNYSPQARQWRALPDVLRLAPGQQHVLSLGMPVRVEAEQGGVPVLASTAQTLQNAVQTSVNLAPGQVGETRLRLSLLGLLPIKDVRVWVQPRRVLIPGGQAIGVALHTSGVLVVGTSDFASAQGGNPAREAGIRPGDLLRTLNGSGIQSAAHLSQMVNTLGAQTLRVGLRRQNSDMEIDVVPRVDDMDGQYRLGVWVRDSTAGVGTLSFYDPQTRAFGALGHAITDVDTGAYLTVGTGQILEAKVVDVLRGAKGEPGELKGSFLKEKRVMGSISKNNAFGIYGAMGDAPGNPLYPQGLPVGAQSAVHEGAASILATVDGDGMREYAIQIVRCTPQNRAGQKSMVLRVTDEALLAKTGGIVQGMSGSPILQDGYIVGAVTHVYVNDPTQGYGMYIDWMLEQVDAGTDLAALPEGA